jgi:hypothetical protein
MVGNRLFFPVLSADEIISFTIIYLIVVGEGVSNPIQTNVWLRLAAMGIIFSLSFLTALTGALFPDLLCILL